MILMTCWLCLQVCPFMRTTEKLSAIWASCSSTSAAQILSGTSLRPPASVPCAPPTQASALMACQILPFLKRAPLWLVPMPMGESPQQGCLWQVSPSACYTWPDLLPAVSLTNSTVCAQHVGSLCVDHFCAWAANASVVECNDASANLGSFVTCLLLLQSICEQC